MTLRFAIAAAACMGLTLMLARADGMPEPGDANYNPVKSVPGTPAPGVKPPPPIKEAKPAPAKAADDAVDADKSPAAPAPTSAPPPPPATSTPPPPAPPPPPPPAATPTSLPATPSAATSLRKPIYEVVSVEVQLGERAPPFATVMVKGTARTGGWKNIALEPLKTFAPEVGLRSFTLVGDPPSGMATQALTPVSVTIRLDPLPDDVKTIRVLGETNEVSQKFR